MAFEKVDSPRRVDQRITVGSQTFREIASNARYEKEFERLIETQKDIFFPPGDVCAFKRKLTSPNGAGVPDLAFVASDFSYWAYIEVELSHHGLYSHVLPQISVFLGAYYDEGNVNYLASKFPLDRDRLASLLKGEPPKVFVISNRFDETWEKEISRLGGHFVSIRLFRSPDSGEMAFFHDGIPNFSLMSGIVTEVRKNRTIPAFIEVLQPARLPIAAGEGLDLVFEGRTCIWERVDTGDKVWLKISGSAPSLRDVPYVIAVEGTAFILKESK